MLSVQEFLLTKTLKDLATEHAVYASFSKNLRKASFNYDMIESKESDMLARPCRGLILSRDSGDWSQEEVIGPTRVVARPFDRFFNHGQHNTDASQYLGKPGTRVFEKLDGTLGIVYWDDVADRWYMATRSVPEADRPIDGFGMHTFSTLFELALKEHLNLDLAGLGERLDRDRTYLFELTTPYNRVVVEYPTPQVHVLGMRNKHTGEEFCPMVEPIPGVPHAPSMQCETIADLIQLVTARSPRESEGLVVRGPNFERVKVKNPAWVALSAVKSSVANSPRRLMEIVILGQGDDVFPMLPPDTAKIGEKYAAQYAEMIRTSDDIYTELSMAAAASDNPRKHLALAVQGRKLWMPFYMDRFQNRCTGFRDYVEQRRDNTGSWPDAFIDNLLHNLPA